MVGVGFHGGTKQLDGEGVVATNYAAPLGLLGVRFKGVGYVCVLSLGVGLAGRLLYGVPIKDCG